MNLAQEFILEIDEVRFNRDILTRIKDMKDDFLARFVGIPKEQASEFKKQFEEFLKERTQFQSLKTAILAFLPRFQAQG